MTEKEVVKKESLERYVGMESGCCPYCSSRPQLVLKYGVHVEREPSVVEITHEQFTEIQAYVLCPNCEARGPVRKRKDYRQYEINVVSLGEYANVWKTVPYSRYKELPRHSFERSDIIVDD